MFKLVLYKSRLLPANHRDSIHASSEASGGHMSLPQRSLATLQFPSRGLLRSLFYRRPFESAGNIGKQNIAASILSPSVRETAPRDTAVGLRVYRRILVSRLAKEP